MTTTADKIIYETDDIFVLGNSRRVDAQIKFEIRDQIDPRVSVFTLTPLHNFVSRWGLELRHDDIVQPLACNWQGQADHLIWVHPDEVELPPQLRVSDLSDSEVAEVRHRIETEWRELLERSGKE